MEGKNMWNFQYDKEPSNLIPAGIYNVIVDKVEVTQSRAGNDMIKLGFKIIDGPYRGRMVFMNYMMSGNEKAVEIARGQLKSLLKCAGKPLDIGGPEGFLDAMVTASIKIKEDKEYGDKNVISYFKPFQGAKEEDAPF
jgi:hypothetical protein